MDEIDALEQRRAAEEEFARRAHEVLEQRELARPQLTFCEDCEEDLHPVRLQHHCTRCVDCQGAFERRVRQYRETR